MQFADLHDTPGRMQEKGVITVRALFFFFFKCCLVCHVLLQYELARYVNNLKSPQGNIGLAAAAPA